MIRRADGLAVLLLLGAVLLANAPGLAGWLDPDPLLVLSGLDHAGQDGVLPGGPGWTDPNTGTTTQALGHLSALDWLRGEVPWWNPYNGVGLPLAAIMQPSSLFLPFVLLLALPKGVLLLKVVMQLVAGLGTLALLRRLGLGGLAAGAGAVAFAMNGTFGWHGAYAPALPPAFLPWILLGVERAVVAARRGRAGGMALLAVALAYSLYAGFPETAYAGGLLAGAWSLLRLAEPDAAGRRLATALRLGGGAALGLMLAAPVLLPFLQYMLAAPLGQRGVGFGMFEFPPRFTALLFFPHIFGLPSGLWPWDVEGATRNLFALNGGWLGLAVSLLALRAVLVRGRQGGLRLLLGAFVALNLAKTMAVPGVTEAFNLIPGVALIPWFRYGPPGWELAAVVLAALAIEDWRGGVVPRRWQAAAPLLLLAAMAAATLWAARPVMESLLRTVPDYSCYPLVSVGAGVALLAGLELALARRPRGVWPAALLVLACLEPVLLCAAPGLAGRRDIAVDLGTVDFLQRHLGLQRFVSWGSIQANYGAYWGIASVNYEYIPVPPDWREAVLRRLDPNAAVFAWRGQSPTGPDGRLLGGRDLLGLVPAYQDMAVRYVVVRNGLPGFEFALPGGKRSALLLPPDTWLAGTLPPAGADTLVRGGSVVVGTYGSQSTGVMALQVCAASGCTTGRALIDGAPDNAPLPFAFDRALALRAGEAARWRLTHEGGGNGVAVWLWTGPDRPQRATDSPWGEQPGQPLIALDAASLRVLAPGFAGRIDGLVAVRDGVARFEFGLPEGERSALPLPPDGTLDGTLPAMDQAAVVTGAAVVIGTYVGTATGRLALRLCAEAGCAGGTAEFAGAADNAPLRVALDRPLMLRAGELVTWRLSHAGGSTGVAVWLWGGAQGQPLLALEPLAAPRVVHRGAAAVIWELPAPAAYFGVLGGPCRLAIRGRQALEASCDAPARLLRRELFWPGWTARVADRRVAIEREGALFQAIDLPAGAARIRFAYAPPHIWVAAALFVLALGVILGAPLRRRAGAKESA